MKTVRTAAQIAETVKRLAGIIQGDRPVILVPILTGAMVFCADLMRQLPPETRVEPLLMERTIGGGHRLVHSPIITPRHFKSDIWVVDDVIASGATLHAAMRHFEPMAQSVVLWGLPSREKRLINPTVIGEELDAPWVAGYGTDTAGECRGFDHLIGKEDAA